MNPNQAQPLESEVVRGHLLKLATDSPPPLGLKMPVPPSAPSEMWLRSARDVWIPWQQHSQEEIQKEQFQNPWKKKKNLWKKN